MKDVNIKSNEKRNIKQNFNPKLNSKLNIKSNLKLNPKLNLKLKQKILFCKDDISHMKDFLLLWITQAFSGLGSSLTSYALVIWSYEQQGKALMTAMLMVCSYAPYVILSIFAGALSDRWNKKKTMLLCDTVAAGTSICVLFLLITGKLQIWHLYAINIVNGLMNTVQQPASDVAISRILPPKYYQKVGGLRYMSNSLNAIMTPVFATVLMAFAGIRSVIVFDLATFCVAAIVLLFLIRIPEDIEENKEKESILSSAKQGIHFLMQEKGIYHLILFLSGINLINAMYQAAFPAMMLSRSGGGVGVMGTVNMTIGISTLLGSFIATFFKKPKSRVSVICNTLLFSMGTENIMLALGRNVWIWSIAAFLGWILIPYMSTNLEAMLRLKVPIDIQGRVFSVRNTFQFFTIPIGYFAGGILVDRVFEPFMEQQCKDSFLAVLLGLGKGSGAALLFVILAFAGVLLCIYFRNDREIRKLRAEEMSYKE